jgi:hypothetical protein
VSNHDSYLVSNGLVFPWRLASRKFMHEALKFARFSKEQMGVEVFMLAGWLDEKGNVKKAK